MRLKAKGDDGWYEIEGFELDQQDYNKFSDRMRSIGVAIMSPRETLENKIRMSRYEFLRNLLQ